LDPFLISSTHNESGVLFADIINSIETRLHACLDADEINRSLRHAPCGGFLLRLQLRPSKGPRASVFATPLILNP